MELGVRCGKVAARCGGVAVWVAVWVGGKGGGVRTVPGAHGGGERAALGEGGVVLDLVRELGRRALCKGQGRG